MVQVPDLLRLAVGTGLLVYASVKDLKERRVANGTWLVGGAAGAALLGLDAWAGRVDWLDLLLIGVIAGLAYAFWYFHLLAGGADAKAIMMLAVLVPLPLQIELAGRAFPAWTSPFPPAFVVFANSLLVFVLIPLLLLAYNLARGDVRFPAMILGYRMDLERAARSFVWVTERVEASGEIRHMLFSSKQTQDEQRENLERLRAAGRTRVWVTPKIPFMVPLLGGFLAAFLLGDVFTKILSATLLRGRGLG